MPTEPIEVSSELELERQRLAKLWDAYEIQEKDLAQSQDKITGLERELEEKDRMIQTLKEVAEARDREIRELEVKVNSLEKEHSQCQPRILDAEDKLKTERARFAKLYSLSEELEEELKDTRKKLEVRDKWFNQNIDIIRNLQRAIDERDSMLGLSKEIPSVKDLE